MEFVLTGKSKMSTSQFRVCPKIPRPVIARRFLPKPVFWARNHPWNNSGDCFVAKHVLSFCRSKRSSQWQNRGICGQILSSINESTFKGWFCHSESFQKLRTDLATWNKRFFSFLRDQNGRPYFLNQFINKKS